MIILTASVMTLLMWYAAELRFYGAIHPNKVDDFMFVLFVIDMMIVYRAGMKRK